MLKKSLILICACLLAACTNNEENVTTKEDVATEASLPQSSEDWQVLVNESEWYRQTTADLPVTDEQLVDFDGDQIPEYALGYGAQEKYGYIIGKYNVTNKEWEKWSELHYEYTVFNEVAFHGILKGQDGKEVLITSDFQPGANTISYEVNLLKASDDNTRVLLGFRQNLYQSNDITVDPVTNSFHLEGPELSQTYILQDKYLLINDDKILLPTGLPIIHNEAFMQVLNNSFTTTKISFLDSFDEGVQKNSVIGEDESFEGVVCKAYEDYSICSDNYDTTQIRPITHIFLYIFRELSAKELSEAIQQEVKIETHDFSDTTEEIFYNASFTIDHVTFHAEFNGPSENSLLLNLSIQNPNSE